MRGQRVLAVVVLSATVTMWPSGCGNEPATTSTNAEPAATLELTQKDSGSTQEMSVGQKMRITVEANHTTGYRWDLDGAAPPQLQQAGPPEYVTSATGLMGAGGNEVWTFAASSRGEGGLKLKYWRSFEPTSPPAATFEVAVTVK